MAQQRSAVHAPPEVKATSITLEDVQYPHPVKFLPLTLYGHDIRMAYMDVPAANQPNGRTVVLLHGMNFYGEYWTGTIDVLRKEGFRVVVPDQVGDKDGPNFPELAKRVCTTIPKCELVLLPGIGHVPHFEAPDMFYKALLKLLKS
jgi:pimeloyl-ACP methyl ester carboxylesterase